MSETKAVFAERTIRSLKNILYRYMEDYGYKYIHKLPQFIATMNSRNNRSINMKPNHVQNSDIMSILYSKPLREDKKPKFGIGDIVRISKYDLLLRKGCKPQFTQDIFEIVTIANHQHIESKANKKFYVENSTIWKNLESFEYGFIYNRVGFQRIFTALSKQHAQFIHKFPAGASEFGRTMGGRNFRDILPINVPKRYRGENYVLR